MYTKEDLLKQLEDMKRQKRNIAGSFIYEEYWASRRRCGYSARCIFPIHERWVAGASNPYLGLYK